MHYVVLIYESPKDFESRGGDRNHPYIAAWRAYHQPGGWLLVASLALAALGAVRQTGFVLLLPLWLWVAWPATGSQRIRGGTVLAAASLAWLVPLLWLAGGPAAYLRELDALSEVTTTATSLWAGTDESIRENRILVGISLAAYIASKLLGARVGTLLGGALGGLISSTAATVSYARRTRGAAEAVDGAAVMIVIASTIVFVRVLFEVAVVAPAGIVTEPPATAVKSVPPVAVPAVVA